VSVNACVGSDLIVSIFEYEKTFLKHFQIDGYRSWVVGQLVTARGIHFLRARQGRFMERMSVPWGIK
jgi:hypothetical protein